MGLYRRFVNLLRSNRLSADIDREMAFHMAERADELVAGGMSEDDARREARRRFGNPGMQKERTRDADVMTWLESVGADVRYAVRALRASPGFALVTIVSLGLGIGANTAIFSLINAVVLKSLPVTHPEELVRVTMGESEGGAVFTNPIWEQIRDRQDMFSGVFAYGNERFNLTAGGEVRRARGVMVSGDYFSTLGVRPEAGRLLARTDDVRGCPAVAVLGHGFWQSEFGGSPSAVGKTITLDRKPYEIVGVTPESFFGVSVGESPQVYVPLCQRSDLDQRSTWYLYIIGRPKPGVTPTQLATRVRALAPAVFAATIPERWGVAEKAEYAKNTLGVRPAPNGLSYVRIQYQKALTVLMVVVGLVLLIACANVANLLLARAAVRGREMAIRLAIGAARRRLVRQLLTESILLAGLGALAGALFARWGTSMLVASLSRGQAPVSLDLTLDGRVLAFTLIVAVATGILFGLAPAWRSTHVDPQLALKAERTRHRRRPHAIFRRKGSGCRTDRAVAGAGDRSRVVVRHVPQPCGARPWLPARGRADRQCGSEPWRLFGQRVHHRAPRPADPDPCAAGRCERRRFSDHAYQRQRVERLHQGGRLLGQERAGRPGVLQRSQRRLFHHARYAVAGRPRLQRPRPLGSPRCGDRERGGGQEVLRRREPTR